MGRNQQPLSKRGGRVALQNVIAVYEYLLKNSTVREARDLQEHGYPAREGEQINVYEGYVIASVESELGLRNSATTQALSMLKAMNAIISIRSGNRIRPSMYLLFYQPTLEQYEEFMGRSYAIERKTMPNRWDSMVNDMVVLRERLTAVERELAELRIHTHGGHDV